MRLVLGLLTVALVGSFSSSAFAEQKESGFEFGGRVGYGIPFGKVGDPDDGEDIDDEDELLLSHWVSGQVPLQLDVGYRINPQFFVGGYFSYGVGFVGDLCDTDNDSEVAVDVDCSASNVRLGAQFTYHFTPLTEGNAGWIGAGMGFEWLNIDQEASATFGGQTISASNEIQLTGFEFLNFQGGYDIVTGDVFRVGPYAMLTVAQYDEVEVESSFEGASESDSESIDNKTMHGWVMFGVKGTFGPF